MRPQGSRNLTYQKKRKTLLIKLQKLIVQRGDKATSMRELARGARTSVNTLQHYFGSQEQLLLAVFGEMHVQGQSYMDGILHLAKLSPDQALRTLLSQLFHAWRPGALEHVHQFGLAVGLSSPKLGAGYIQSILEPTLQSVERLFECMEERRTIVPLQDHRVAALALLSPLILALLHQNNLHGSNCRKLDIPLMIDRHLSHFLLGWIRPIE